MLKEVTRTLYIDGKLIADWTQDPWEDSELSDRLKAVLMSAIIPVIRAVRSGKEGRTFIPLNPRSSKTMADAG